MAEKSTEKRTPAAASTGAESPIHLAIDGGARLVEGLAEAGFGLAGDVRETLVSVAGGALDWIEANQRASVRVARNVVDRLDRLSREGICLAERLALATIRLTRTATKDVTEVASRAATLTLVRPADATAANAA